MPILKDTIEKKFNWKDKVEELNNSITANRATWLSNNPEKMTAEEIKAFSKVLDIPVHELVHDYNCGYEKLTVSELDSLVKESENQSKITHAI